jgi:hypothetical protein
MGRCVNSVVVGAPADAVWTVLRNFHQMDWAKGVVERVDVVGDRAGDQVGARRVLNGVFHETLLGIDDEERIIHYSIDDGPGPVSREMVRNYRGRVEAFPVTATGQTFVRWTSRYDSAHDDAVGELCNPIYQALLGALQRHFQ